MEKNPSGKVAKTKAIESFKKAKSKAEEYVKDSEKLNDLIDKASKKASNKMRALDAFGLN